MGTLTSNGLPIPVGTDKVRDGDDAIAALGNALNLRVPKPKVYMVDGGYTTNAYGGIVFNVPGFTQQGGVGCTEAKGYAVQHSPGAPVGQAWFNIYQTVNAATVPNTFVILHGYTWGT